jgi:hypothetical protein
MIPRPVRNNYYMKAMSGVLVACALAVTAFAQETKTPAESGQIAATNKLAQSTQTFPASAATVSAPFVLTNGYISQPELTDVAVGGKAVFNFTLTASGSYLIAAMVNAPDDTANSLYVNVDAQPEDPAMIWDIETTKGFEARTVSWRGNGSDGNDEFTPKLFNLSTGTHQLVIVGREPTELKSVSIRLASMPK